MWFSQYLSNDQTRSKPTQNGLPNGCLFFIWFYLQRYTTPLLTLFTVMSCQPAKVPNQVHCLDKTCHIGRKELSQGITLLYSLYKYSSLVYIYKKKHSAKLMNIVWQIMTKVPLNFIISVYLSLYCKHLPILVDHNLTFDIIVRL